jgi:hypothetical protein
MGKADDRRCEHKYQALRLSVSFENHPFLRGGPKLEFTSLQQCACKPITKPNWAGGSLKWQAEPEQIELKNRRTREAHIDDRHRRITQHIAFEDITLGRDSAD